MDKILGLFVGGFRKILPEGTMAKAGGVLGVLAGGISLLIDYAHQWFGLSVPGFTPMDHQAALVALAGGLGILGIRLRQERKG